MELEQHNQTNQRRQPIYRTMVLAGLIAILCAMAAPQLAQAQDSSQTQEETAAAGKSAVNEFLTRFLDAEGKYSKDPSEENWKTLEALIDPEFVLYQADSLPYPGVWRGPEGFKAWMKAMAGNFTSFGGRDARIMVEGNDFVVVLTFVGEARKTGKHIEMSIAQVNKIRNGRFLEVRPFYWDTAAMSAALGHNPT